VFNPEVFVQYNGVKASQCLTDLQM